MRICGHKTRSVFDRYNLLSERDMVDPARKVQAHQNAEIQRIKDHSAGKKNGRPFQDGRLQHGAENRT